MVSLSSAWVTHKIYIEGQLHSEIPPQDAGMSRIQTHNLTFTVSTLSCFEVVFFSHLLAVLCHLYFKQQTVSVANFDDGDD